MRQLEVPVKIWNDCYTESWKGYIADEAFEHPAKMAKGLLRRIVWYLMSKHELEKDDTVLDPFGGIGTTGIECSQNWLKSVLVEVEPKYVGLINKNIALYERAWKSNGRPVPTVILGDSRNLGDLIGHVKIDMIISSPPFQDCNICNNEDNGVRVNRNKQVMRKNRDPKIAPGQKAVSLSYGKSNGQLGNMKTDEFWELSKKILEECYSVLKPGGMAAWVVKAFVKNKQIVDFPEQWKDACESVGFETVEKVRAMQVREIKRDGFFGVTTKIKDRKSFFKRLQEQKGAPKIDYEVVWFMRKP